jgi:hypothetical protein
VIRRLAWLAAAAGAGVAVAVAMRKLDAARRLATPDGVAWVIDIGFEQVRGLAGRVRQAAQEREAELREQLGVDHPPEDARAAIRQAKARVRGSEPIYDF